MTAPRYFLAPSLMAVALAACTHTTAPTTSSDNGPPTGPFNSSVPTRLTWYALRDRAAAWSENSRYFTYSYESGRSDRDVCIGVMNGGGGSRTIERCGWGADDALWADGLDGSTISPGGNLLFVRHRSLPFEAGYRTAELYSVPMNRAASTPTKIADLGRIPPRGARRWDTFLNPTWLPDGSLLVLGAHSIRRPSCVDPCPFDRFRFNGPDTLTLGVELARISGLDNGQMQVTSLAAVPGLLSLARDGSNGQILVVRQYHDPTDDSFYESFADTVFTVATNGGAFTPIAGTPREGAPPLERFHAVAAAGGRVFIARSWYSSATPPLQPSGLSSDIAELLPDGSLTSRWAAPGGGGTRWKRIAAAPDGSAILAELETGTTSDIYLIPLR
jgi:hypothetical protein